MFFDVELLCRQSGGVFYLPWLAAIHGVKTHSVQRATALVHISDRSVRDADIVQLCESLARYVTTSSLDARQRVSLRLGSTLLYGIVRIFRRKVVLFQGEVYDFFANIQRPIIREITTERPRRPRAPGVRRPRRALPVRSEDLMPFEMVQEIRDEDVIAALQEAPRAPPEAITLPDDVPRQPIADLDEQFGDEQFPDVQRAFLETDFSSVGDIRSIMEQAGTAANLSFFFNQSSSARDYNGSG